MDFDELLAYLAGVIDSDGYLKVMKGYRTRGTVFPHYGTTVGLQQLWPGNAVRLFASTFSGQMKLWPLPSGRQIARCEIHCRKAEAAARRLLPYLLVKKDQALVLLEVARLNRVTRNRSRERYRDLAAARQTLVSLHEGSWAKASNPLPLPASQRGYERMRPVQLGWTRNQVFAYLAGVMDSDGNFRTEKKHVRNMIGPHYRINIRCAQVSPSPAVELLAETFGGRLHVSKSRRLNHRDLVCWSLHDRTAASAIEALLPYLIVKEAEAYLLLELRRLKAQGKKGMTEWEHPNRWRDSVKMRKRCYTPEQTAGFERIHRAIQALHSARSDWPESEGPQSNTE
ncbi:MAG: hypothetical protein AABX97_06725 [Candidatus Thermoplasmatota archaeon]